MKQTTATESAATETAADLLNRAPMSRDTAIDIFQTAVKNPADIAADALREALTALDLSMADLRNDRALHLELIGIDRELADAHSAHEAAAAALREQNAACVPLRKAYEQAAAGKASRIASQRSDVVQKLARNFNPPQQGQGTGRMSFPRVASA